jgi:hypothetical protein
MNRAETTELTDRNFSDAIKNYQKSRNFRVERFVTSPLPHRPVLASFSHTVPLKSVSLEDKSDKSLVLSEASTLL